MTSTTLRAVTLLGATMTMGLAAGTGLDGGRGRAELHRVVAGYGVRG